MSYPEEVKCNVKKMNRSLAEASVGVAAAPEQSAPQTPATPAPAAPAQSTAMTLAQAGAAQLPATLTLPPSSTPWLGFYEKAGDDVRRAAVTAQLGALSIGTPYICKGTRYFKAADFAYCLLGAEPLHYWAVFGGDNKEEKVWLTKPAFDKFEGRRVTEQVRAVLLVLPGTQPLPEELAPATVVTVSFRSAKVPAIRGLSAGVAEAQTPEWAKLNGRLVEVAPSFRVTGQFQLSTGIVQSGDNKGRSYGKATMRCAPTTVGQINALEAWAAAGGLEKFQEALRLHNVICTRVRELGGADEDGE